MTTENNLLLIVLIVAATVALFMAGFTVGNIVTLRKVTREMKSRSSEFFLN